MSSHSPLRGLALLYGAALGCSGFGLLAQEQPFFTGRPAVSFTAAQAERGKKVYDGNCASCHGPNLEDGQFGPPLRGSAFKSHGSSQSSDALFSYIFANAAGCAGRAG